MTNNKIIIVPDVHGRTFWESARDQDCLIIFLGDYLDPYPHENITCEDAIDNFQKIIDFKRTHIDQVILLLGNHDCHYIGISDDRCRKDWDNMLQIYTMFVSNKDLFQFAYRWNDTLFTHAGVTTGWLKQSGYHDNPDTIVDQLNRNIEFSIDTFNDSRGDIGFLRGGYQDYGGPVWADAREVFTSPAFAGKLTQIVGHTQLIENGDVVKASKYEVYDVDSREVHVWDGKTITKL